MCVKVNKMKCEGAFEQRFKYAGVDPLHVRDQKDADVLGTIPGVK